MKYDFSNLVGVLKINTCQVYFIPQVSLPVGSNSKKQEFWWCDWFEFRKSYTYSVLSLYTNLKVPNNIQPWGRDFGVYYLEQGCKIAVEHALVKDKL